MAAAPRSFPGMRSWVSTICWAASATPARRSIRWLKHSRQKDPLASLLHLRCFIGLPTRWAPPDQSGTVLILRKMVCQGARVFRAPFASALEESLDAQDGIGPRSLGGYELVAVDFGDLPVPRLHGPKDLDDGAGFDLLPHPPALGDGGKEADGDETDRNGWHDAPTGECVWIKEVGPS